jgi:hypothetical protein
MDSPNYALSGRKPHINNTLLTKGKYMNHQSRLFPVLILTFSFFLPLAAFGHGSLLLKSTSSERSYSTALNADGSFSFTNVIPGTYSLMIVGPKEYFAAKANEASPEISVENLQWFATGNGAPTSYVILPSMTAPSDRFSNPCYTKGAEPNKEYSVTLYSVLVTSRRATLTGTITNAGSHEEQPSKQSLVVGSR